MTAPFSMVRYRSVVLLAWFICAPCWSSEVRSPNDKIAVTVGVDEYGRPAYSIAYNDEPVIVKSRLGLRFQSHHDFAGEFGVAGVSSWASDTQWEQPWGERRLINDRFNGLVVNFESTEPVHRQFSVRFRVYDDGVGFRYEVPGSKDYGQLHIVDEITEFHLAGPATAWWIPGRRFNRYEYLYNATELDAIETAHTPMTVRLASGVHLSFHEAALTDYAAYVLDQRRPGVFKTNLTPWSDGVRVKVSTPFKTPWRTIQISAQATGLLNSDLILNLNEPNALGDVSWVKPGKYVGIWWAMHIGKRTWHSGPDHGATTDETRRYIDFAAKHGFDGVLVEGWNIGWDGDWFHNGDRFDFSRTYDDFDIEAIADYGAKRGVRLIGHHETFGNVTRYRRQMQDAFDLYESHGVRQVKTGYVADGGTLKRTDDEGMVHYEWHDGQFGVNQYLLSVTEAAKRKISINTHEPIKDTGLRRTYPNWISREGARGQEFNAWNDPPNPPEHTVNLAYTRMLAGPMDFTPGIFDLTFEGEGAKQRVQTTLAKQLALYVVLYSPIQMAADLPENYEARPDAFQFIVDVPTDWERSIAIDGAVGDFVVFARRERGGSDWYLGAITDEESRTLSVPLDFLDDGLQYSAEIYRDGDDAHWESNPYAVTIESRAVRRGTVLELPLAAGGGVAIRFIPKR